MKVLFKTSVFGLLLLVFTTSCAATVRLRPIDKVEVTEVHNPRVVVRKKVNYYRRGGVWYVKKNRRYVTVSAPIGLRVKTLPTGYSVVKVRGVK